MIYVRKPEVGKKFVGVFLRTPLRSHSTEEYFVDVHHYRMDFIHEDKFNIVAPTELAFWKD